MIIISLLFFSFLCRDAILVPCVDCITSFFSGFVIFTVLGFMAKEKNVSVEKVVDGGKQNCTFNTFITSLFILRFIENQTGWVNKIVLTRNNLNNIIQSDKINIQNKLIIIIILEKNNHSLNI